MTQVNGRYPGPGRIGSNGRGVVAALLAAPATPTLTWVTGATDNTPQLLLDGALVEGATVREQHSLSSDFSSGVFESTNTVDATEDAANELDFTGIGALADGTWSVRMRIEIPGHTNSDWSNTETKTIDTTAPTISTSGTQTVAENAALSVSLTANETVTWAIRTAVQNAASLDHDEFEISGTTLRFTSNGTHDFESPTDTNTDNAYVVVVRATDTAGNTTDKTITVTVTDVAEGGGATIFVSPQANVALTNGGLTATSTGVDTGGTNRALTNVGHASGKYYFEMTLGHAAADYCAGVGIEGTATPSNYAEHYNNDSQLYINGSPSAMGTNFNLDAVRVDYAVDLDNKRLSSRINGGDWNNSGVNNPALNIGGVDISALTGTLFVAVVVNDNGGNHSSQTFNFGATSYAGTAPVGFGNW